MPVVKYDVSNVEDIQEGVHAPTGTYRAKVRSVAGPMASKSNPANQMLEVVFDLTHDAAGKKLDQTYMPLWYYPILNHDSEFVQGRLKEFLFAFGLKPKGQFNTDKIVGKSVQLKLKHDTDQDGEYRPRVSKVMGLAEQAGEPEDAEPEDEAEDEDNGEVDLETLTRAELKKLIKENELEIRVTKGMSDDDLRGAIAEQLEEEDEAEEPEEEEPEDEGEEGEEPEAEEEDDGYDEMSVSDLKAELKERELATNGAKKVLIARLRKDDSSEPF
jgi:hypothetical protein